MSHVVSVTPAGPVTLAPGGSQDFDVAVSGVPGDDHLRLTGVGDDGLAVAVDIVVDRAELRGVTAGTPAPNEVKATADGGSLVVVGSVAPGVVRFRYTAPA